MRLFFLSFLNCGTRFFLFFWVSTPAPHVSNGFILQWNSLLHRALAKCIVLQCNKLQHTDKKCKTSGGESACERRGREVGGGTERVGGSERRVRERESEQASESAERRRGNRGNYPSFRTLNPFFSFFLVSNPIFGFVCTN